MKNHGILVLMLVFSAMGFAQKELRSTFAMNEQSSELFKVKSEKEQLDEAFASPSNPGIRPGDELIKFGKMYYTGLGIAVGGYVLMIASAVTYNEEFIILGALASAGGYITMLASHTHIMKAGRMMNHLDDQYQRELQKRKESSFKFNSSKNGVGLAYNF